MPSIQMAIQRVHKTGGIKMIPKAEISRGTVENFLSARPSLSHIKVKTRGNVLTLESTDEDGTTYPHARFKKKSVHKWDLEMPVRNGWEPTFIEGTTEELLQCLVEKFPWTLAPQ